MRQELTPKQSETFDFIVEKIETDGCPPTLRELSERFGVNLTAIQQRLRGLKNKGWIDWQPGRQRGLKVVPARSPFELPLLGFIKDKYPNRKAS